MEEGANMLREIVWKIGGEQGQGLDPTSDVFATVCNRMGYWVYAYKTFSSRIKGGHTDFTVRVSQDHKLSPAPKLHMLVAIDQESIDLLAGDLREDGILLADSGFKPQAPQGVTMITADLTRMARDLGNPVFRNMIAVGASAHVLGIPLEPFKQYVQEKFGRKGEAVVKGNWDALDMGAGIAIEQLGERGFRLGDPDGKSDRVLVTGNDAMTLGALAAGCRTIFAYPITPASEVLEVGAKILPKFGGVSVQMEDELGALGAVLGAGFAGARALTCTSGPGLSLMQELLGLAGMTEIPVVVIDTQRGGPSTGMPTKMEQSDLLAMVSGGHGEAPRIVMAPGTGDQAFYDTVTAFNLADNYHCPVIIASDLGLALWQQTVDPFDLSKVVIDRGPIVEQAELDTLGRDGFERYADSDTGVSARSFPGMRNGQYLATGAEHGRTGKVTENAANRDRMMRRRFKKIEGALEIGGKVVPGVEYDGPANPDVLLISYGSTIGPVREAAENLAAEGRSVGVCQIRLINPLPVEDLTRLIKSAKLSLVIECNFTGQMAYLMRANRVPFETVRSILKFDGTLLRGDEVTELVRNETRSLPQPATAQAAEARR
jgi:2-oxoglutarate ferredoxin oxidoreductase subunit alpha